MSKIAQYMLSDIEKNTVDFMPNFDDRLQEPTVLPARIPALLANGSSGIAVGMATNIPPHNLTELANGIIKIIDEDNVTDEDLMTVIKGPDFPTGGIILGNSGIRKAYETGKGTITIRGKIEMEEKNGKNKSKIRKPDQNGAPASPSTLRRGFLPSSWKRSASRWSRPRPSRTWQDC
jgi:DNA gyrase subunit A